MSDDRMSSTEKLDASRLIELFLRLVSADDVRQLVLEMEEELAKPIHLSVVKAELFPPFGERSSEATQTAPAPNLISEETTGLHSAIEPAKSQHDVTIMDRMAPGSHNGTVWNLSLQTDVGTETSPGPCGSID